MFAVRLVSSGSESTKQVPGLVYLKRDPVKRQQGERKYWSGNVSANRYYTYHHPQALRASDSYLEREFHTEYSYRENEPDRNTYDDRERRSKFHFPEMKAAPPANDAASRAIASVFGRGTALAAVPESRFETQIKYYRKTGNTRCLVIGTTLDSTDNGSLRVTMVDLDYPNPFDVLASGVWWGINWAKK
jgi:hypothetical protein